MHSRVLNLHNHTPFSDGAYTIDELCEAHVELRDEGVAGLGISDHLFVTPSSRKVASEREFEQIFARETDQYIAAVREAQERWAGKLEVFCGAEVCWPLNKTMLNAIRKVAHRFDFLWFEQVDWAGLTQLANQAKRWPCPIGIAHCDVEEAFPNTSIDQVVRTLANARIIYEVNTAKMLPLSRHKRWLSILPKHRVNISIGTDTHDDLRCLQDLPTVHRTLSDYGLAERFFRPNARSQSEAMSA